MSNNVLEKRIEELERELELVKAELEKQVEKSNPRWKPKEREEYYCITGYSEVKHINWGNHSFDKGKLSIGNVFRTKEEAEFALERLKVIAELKEYASEFVVGKDNFYLYFAYTDGKVKYDSLFEMHCSELYFPSREIVKQAIAAVGEDRVKKYYLRVK